MCVFGEFSFKIDETGVCIDNRGESSLREMFMFNRGGKYKTGPYS